MKKLIALLITLTLIMASSSIAFADSNGTGFVDGKNATARIFNGIYPSVPNATLIMKWSKDWIPMANEPVGAWVTNHWTWYSDNFNTDTWYGWDNRTTYGEGEYRITEFTKIMKVSDNNKAWLEYEAAGAYGLWGTFDSGTPEYVAFVDNINVYDATTGELVYSTNLINGPNKGFGKAIF